MKPTKVPRQSQYKKRTVSLHPGGVTSLEGMFHLGTLQLLVQGLKVLERCTLIGTNTLQIRRCVFFVFLFNGTVYMCFCMADKEGSLMACLRALSKVYRLPTEPG